MQNGDFFAACGGEDFLGYLNTYFSAPGENLIFCPERRHYF